MRVASLLSEGRRRQVDVPNLKKKKKKKLLSAAATVERKKGYTLRTASEFTEGHYHKLVGS